MFSEYAIAPYRIDIEYDYRGYEIHTYSSKYFEDCIGVELENSPQFEAIYKQIRKSLPDSSEYDIKQELHAFELHSYYYPETDDIKLTIFKRYGNSRCDMSDYDGLTKTEKDIYEFILTEEDKEELKEVIKEHIKEHNDMVWWKLENRQGFIDSFDDFEDDHNYQFEEIDLDDYLLGKEFSWFSIPCTATSKEEKINAIIKPYGAVLEEYSIEFSAEYDFEKEQITLRFEICSDDDDTKSIIKDVLLDYDFIEVINENYDRTEYKLVLDEEESALLENLFKQEMNKQRYFQKWAKETDEYPIGLNKLQEQLKKNKKDFLEYKEADKTLVKMRAESKLEKVRKSLESAQDDLRKQWREFEEFVDSAKDFIDTVNERAKTLNLEDEEFAKQVKSLEEAINTFENELEEYEDGDERYEYINNEEELEDDE